MEQEKLDEILKKHELWLKSEAGGEKADLSEADLRWANLSGADLKEADLRWADLRWANLSGANLRWANLRWTNLSGASLSGADLRRADLSGANLKKADLSGANLKKADLDYSCLPLWCGSLDANFDDEQLYQIAYHLVRAGLHSKNASDETKKELSKMIDFANKFHRAGQCGEIELEEMMK